MTREQLRHYSIGWEMSRRVTKYISHLRPVREFFPAFYSYVCLEFSCWFVCRCCRVLGQHHARAPRPQPQSHEPPRRSGETPEPVASCTTTFTCVVIIVLENVDDEVAIQDQVAEPATLRELHQLPASALPSDPNYSAIAIRNLAEAKKKPPVFTEPEKNASTSPASLPAVPLITWSRASPSRSLRMSSGTSIASRNKSSFSMNNSKSMSLPPAN